MKGRKTKEPGAGTSRVRKTNLDLLGGVPHEVLRLLRATALRADLPLSRVFQDVLAIGLNVISDPQESPYSGLISFRESLEIKQKGYATERTPGPPESSEASRFGGAGVQAWDSDLGEAIHEPGPGSMATGVAATDRDGPSDAVERPGLETSDEEADAVFPRVE
jgi:hypothetical protein